MDPTDASAIVTAGPGGGRGDFARWPNFPEAPRPEVPRTGRRKGPYSNDHNY
jgi:hypothetical protein